MPCPMPLFYYSLQLNVCDFITCYFIIPVNFLLGAEGGGGSLGLFYCLILYADHPLVCTGHNI